MQLRARAFLKIKSKLHKGLVCKSPKKVSSNGNMKIKLYKRGRPKVCLIKKEII